MLTLLSFGGEFPDGTQIVGNVSVCSEAILGLVELCGPTFGNLNQQPEPTCTEHGS